MRLIVIESPYGKNIDGTPADPKTVEQNLDYLRACMADALRRGEAPFASHGLYTQPGVLDDTNPEERKQGMQAGWAWHRVAQAVVVYTDFGITPGMRAGVDHALSMGCEVVERALGFEWEKVAAERENTP